MNDSFVFLLSTCLDSLPPVRYTPASALDTQIHNMGLTDPKSAVETSTEGLEYAGKIYDKFMNGETPFAKSVQTEAFTRLADSFAVGFKQARDQVRDAAKVVDLMTAEISRRANAVFSEDPRTVHLVKNPQGETKLDQVRWDKFDTIDERKLVGVMHSRFNISPEHDIDRSTLSLVLNDIPFANSTNRHNVGRIDIPEERADAILHRLKAALKNDVSERSIRTIIAELFTMTEGSCNTIVNNLNRYASDPYSVDINELINQVYTYQKVLPLMTPDLMDLAPSTYEQIKERIQILADYTYAAAYICSYYRNDVWKDAIEVPGRLINTDNWSAYKAKGGTVLHLVQHNNYHYPENEKLPPQGVTLRHAVETIGEVERAIQQQTGVALDELNRIQKRVVRDCFILVGKEALESFAKSKRLAPSMVGQNFESFARACYDNSIDVPLENACYKLVMTSQYQGTATEALYEKYSGALTDLASKARNLSKEDCDLIEAGVVADLLVNTMIDRGIIVVG